MLNDSVLDPGEDFEVKTVSSADLGLEDELAKFQPVCSRF
jgi:hypothetical protein